MGKTSGKKNAWNHKTIGKAEDRLNKVWKIKKI